MKHATRVTLTAEAQSAFDLINQSDDGTVGILVQRVSGTIQLGSKSAQPFTMNAAQTTPAGVYFEHITNTKNLWLSGAGAVVNLGIF